MIINEGVLVKIRGDNRDLLQSFKGGKFAAGAFASAVAASLAAVSAASLRMSAQLDRDLRLVATLGGEAAQSTGRLREEIKQLGVEFGRDFRELARANYQAVSGGFKDIAGSMRLTRAGTKLAVAGNADLVTSTEAVVKALNAFDLEARQAEEASAQLWGITRDGIITVEQLGKFLADLPVTAAQSGIEFEELSAAISTLTAQGVPASTAMDQLRSAIIKLEQNGVTGSLVERMRQFVGQGIGELTTALGDQTAARGVQVLASNLATLEDNVRAAGDVTDDYNKAVETMTSGSLSEWEQLQQNIASHMEDLGKALDEVVNPALVTMNALLADTPRNVTVSGIGEDGRIVSVQDIANRERAAPGIEAAEASANARNFLLEGTQGTPGIEMTEARRLADFLNDINEAYSPAGPPRFVTPPTTGRPRLSDPTRAFIAGDLGPPPEFGELESAMEETGQSAALASQATSILASSVGGLLVSAFGQAESAVGRFALGLLAQFAQLGAQIGVSALIPGPQFMGFASGGYTGGRAGQPRGIVHGNEYVFNDKAVSSIGLGRLERMHAAAQAGSTSNTVNVTVNAGSGDAASIANVTADAVGQKMRELQTTGRGSLYTAAPQKYRR